MSESIIDGSGKGYLVKVDNENLLHSKSVVETLVTHRSHYNASAFTVETPFLNITTTGGRVLYLKNTDTIKNFYITEIRADWNGGNTTGIKTVQLQAGFTDTQHDTNVTATLMGCLNKTSNNTADVTALYWDGIGDGMTGGTLGAVGVNTIVAKGTIILPIEGSIILGINNSIVFNMKAEEVGVGCINIRGYFEDK